MPKFGVQDHTDYDNLIGNDQVAVLSSTVKYLMECILIRRKVEFFVLKLLLMFFFISGSFYRQEFQKTLLMLRL